MSHLYETFVNIRKFWQTERKSRDFQNMVIITTLL